MFVDQNSALRRSQWFHAPTTLEEAASLLDEHRGQVRLAAGCTYLMLQAAHGDRLSEHLVSLHRVPGLDDLATGRFGALTTLRRLERWTRSGPERAATMAASVVAGPSVRTLGTIGGNIGFADGDLAAALMAMGAVVHLHDGSSMPVGDFVIAKPLDRIVTHVTHQLRSEDGWSGATIKLKRRSMDWPVVTVSAQLRLVDGVIEDCRVAAQSLTAEPTLLPAVASVLVGSQGEPEALDYAAEAVTHRLEPREDAEASGAYRRTVAPVITRRVLELALSLGPDDDVDLRKAHG